MRAPENPEDPVPYKVNLGGKEKIHDYYNTTIDDIFRKFDLQLNGQLSAKELNQFGEIVDDDDLKNITTEDFFKPEYWNVSCNENGLTKFGLKQLFYHFSESKMSNILTKLGYDESLYSNKSRVYTLSVHSDSMVRVRIGDAMKTDLNEQAWDMMMHYYSNKFGNTGASQNDQCLVFRMQHEKSYSITFGAINKT
jgi:translation elongation factor EF-G